MHKETQNKINQIPNVLETEFNNYGIAKAREKNKTLLPTRPKKTISDNINRISRNIMRNLSPNELKKDEAEYPEYFKDGKINKEKWQGKNIEEYIAAENSQSYNYNNYNCNRN